MHVVRCVIAGATLILVFGSFVGKLPAYGAAEDQAAVTLSVPQALEIDIIEPELVLSVPTSAFCTGKAETVMDSSTVLACTNAPAQIRCPQHVEVTDPGSYKLDALVFLVGAGGVGPVDDYWYLNLGPGCYNPFSGKPNELILLTVSITKIWDGSDVAGTYTGAVTLDLLPQQ